MATVKILTNIGATKLFLTAIGGSTTGTPNPAGYDLTQVVDLLHSATVTGLTGVHYAECKDDDGVLMSRTNQIEMVDDDSVIDVPALLNVPSAEEISNRLERTDGPIDKVPKFGDGQKRTKSSASSSELIETVTKVDP